MSRQSELKAAYKREARPMGVYAVCVAGVAFVGTSTDLDGILNRHRFELKMGGHRNRTLAALWRAHGLDVFSFEVVDRLEPKDGQDTEAELKTLLALRLEQGLANADGRVLHLLPI